jgi:hypothetical protein
MTMMMMGNDDYYYYDCGAEAGGIAMPARPVTKAMMRAS